MKFTNEQIIAQEALFGSLKGSKIVDTFACWLLAGFGAALTIIITNIGLQKISENKIYVAIFLIATCICIIQKYISVIITCGFEANEEVKKRILLLSQVNKDIFKDFDFEKYSTEVLKPYWKFSRRFIDSILKKVINGDLNAGGRVFIYCFQVQSILVLVQALLLIISAWGILSGI